MEKLFIGNFVVPVSSVKNVEDWFGSRGRYVTFIKYGIIFTTLVELRKFCQRKQPNIGSIHVLQKYWTIACMTA